MAHPTALTWLITFFLGAAGGAAGATVVAAATSKKDESQGPALPAKVSGADSDQLSGAATCDWRQATNKDLDPYIVSKYREQLKTNVGTHRIVQHNNVTWLLETVSKETDPDFTKHGKDVRGWIRVKKPVDSVATIDSADDHPPEIEAKAPSVVATFSPPSVPPVPVVTATLSGADERHHKRMKLGVGGVVTSNPIDDLGSGVDDVGDAVDLGLAVRTVTDPNDRAIVLRETQSKFAIPIRIAGPPSAAPAAPAAAPASSTAPAAAPAKAGPPSTAPAAPAAAPAKAGPPSTAPAAPAASKKK